MSNIKKVSPLEAYKVLQNDAQAVLIDTRTDVEFYFVGHPIGAVNVPLKSPPTWDVFANFVEQVEKNLPSKSTPVVLMCRSGVRSMEAAKLLEEAGYQSLYNVEEGFEGDKDGQNHRGTLGGWRFHKLPWQQS